MITSLRRSFVIIAGALLVVAACGGDDQPSLGGLATEPGGAVVTGEPLAPSSPAVTDPTAPATDVATASSVADGADDADDDDDDSSVPGWVVPGGAVLALAVVVALWFAVRHRGDGDRDTSRQRQAIALAGWIHDQLSLEVLALPAADGSRRWDQERNRLDQLTIEARAFATVEDAVMWNRLVEVLQALATSIDVSLRLRGTPGTDDDLLRESVTIANRHRAELANWLTTATATI